MATALFITFKNMSLISSLCGRKAVQEFTSVGAVPTIDGGGAVVANLKSRPYASRLARLRRRRGPVREEVIPNDASELDLANLSPGASQDDAGAGPGDDGQGNVNPDMLPTSLALVAPDCTPGWNIPLSPAQLPTSVRKTEPPEPEVAGSTAGTANVAGALKLAGAGITDTSTMHSAEALGESLASSVVAPISGEALLAQGMPMPDPVQSNTAARALKMFSFK